MEQRDSDDESGPSSRPMSAMALIAMSAGLSWRDLREMKYTHLVHLLYEWEDMNKKSEGEEEPSNDASFLMGL